MKWIFALVLLLIYNTAALAANQSAAFDLKNKEIVAQPSNRKKPYEPPPHRLNYNTAHNTGWYASVGGGLAFPSFNSNLTIANNSGFPGTFSQDLYTTQNNNQPLFEMSFGHRWERPKLWLPAYSLGFYYQHFFTTNMGGNITQYSSPVYTNYNYNWNVTADVLLVGLKLNLIQYRRLAPYLKAAAGFSYNKSNGYSESPLPGLTDTRVSAGFQANTSTQFAYNAGIGLDFQASGNFIVSAEYQYQNLGTMSLGNGSNAWSGQSLSLGQYHANAFLFSLTYLLG